MFVVKGFFENLFVFLKLPLPINRQRELQLNYSIILTSIARVYPLVFSKDLTENPRRS